MSYLNEIKSFITYNSEFKPNLTIRMEIESGKAAETITTIDNHLDAFIDLINNDIENILIGYNVTNQLVIDEIISNLPKELNRKIPNELLFGLSITVSKLAAMFYGIDLYRYLAGPKKINYPVVLLNKDNEQVFFELNDLSKPIGKLLKTDKIEKIKDKLSTTLFLDLYSINQTTINNLNKTYPNLLFISNKDLNNAYKYTNINDFKTISDLLSERVDFINSKYIDASLADIAIALNVKYLSVTSDVLNRLISIINLE